MEKYRVTVLLCEAIELTEGNYLYCTESCIFQPGQFSLEKVEAGYERCEAYRWLREHGGIEGQYECQTILNENEEMVRTVISRIQRQWIEADNEPGPSERHMVRYCSTCKMPGCEDCEYVRSLRSLVRSQKPDERWFL